MPRLSHTEPSQKENTHCLVAACLSLKPKPSGSQQCATPSYVIHRPSDLLPEHAVWTGLHQSALACSGAYNAPPHLRRSAMHNQRCTRLFACVHGDDFDISLIYTFIYLWNNQICWVISLRMVLVLSAVGWNGDSWSLKIRSAHGGVKLSWWACPFSPPPIGNDCSITFLFFGMILKQFNDQCSE